MRNTLSNLNSILLPCVLPAGMLLFRLINYEAHSDGAFGAVVVSGVILVIRLLYLIHYIRAGEKKESFLAIASCALLLACLIIALRVPNCPVCDGCRPEDYPLLSLFIPMGNP